ncbi:wax ester/triacylglycerol synthase domain-containing protein [Streptomyces alfalfae]|uniref:diacylglycerol O-acyltransferase n=1 Tax=Streptomyces alfalfae TaxID=1642299 RepID=A0A7T4U113_9ACTN|nr:wax ester/triacylglycerol synthase domain-containing protein [Streptomyces alfalfae]QQC92403.1 DUF1298 domain-containing protein [Streptomyces alfalfae]
MIRQQMVDTSLPEPDPMTPKDYMVWRLEEGRHVRTVIGILLILDGPVEWQDLVDWHHRACAVLPRMRSRVVARRGPLRLPAWEPEPQFAVSDHLQRVVVSGKGSHEDLLRTAENLAELPFRPGRSPWDGYLVEGLENGTTAYLLKISHSIADGIRLRKLFLRQAADARRNSRAGQETSAPTAPPIGATKTESAGAAAEASGGTGPRPSRNGSPGLTPSPSRRASLQKAGRQTFKAMEFVKEAISGLVDAPGPASVADGRFSRHYVTLDLPLAKMREKATAADGTVHDVLVAGVAAGFDLYREGVRPNRKHLRVFCPYGGSPQADRKAALASAGNHWFIVSFGVPAGLSDPLPLIRAVRSSVDKVYHRDAIDWMGGLARTTPILPRKWLGAVFLRYLASHDFVISNIPGPSTVMSVAGAQVVRAYGIAPAIGAATTVTLLSYQGVCQVMLNIDTAVVGDPEFLGQCVKSGLEGILVAA